MDQRFVESGRFDMCRAPLPLGESFDESLPLRMHTEHRSELLTRHTVGLLHERAKRERDGLTCKRVESKSIRDERKLVSQTQRAALAQGRPSSRPCEPPSRRPSQR